MQKAAKRRWVILCVAVCLGVLFPGCGATASSAETASMAAISLPSPETAFLYTSRDLDFTFQVPPSWVPKDEPYSVQTEVTEGAEHTAYTTFYFSEESRIPILQIRREASELKAVPVSGSAVSEQTLSYLGTNSGYYYYAVIPETCTLPVGKDADAYNAMTLSEAEVKRRFSLAVSVSAAELPASQP